MKKKTIFAVTVCAAAFFLCACATARKGDMPDLSEEKLAGEPSGEKEEEGSEGIYNAPDENNESKPTDNGGVISPDVMTDKGVVSPPDVSGSRVTVR